MPWTLTLNIWPCTAFRDWVKRHATVALLILITFNFCWITFSLLLGSIYSLMKFISRSSHVKLMGREQSVKTLWYNGLLVGYRLTVYRIQVISTTYIIYPLDSFLLPNFLVVGGQHHKSPRYQAFFFLNYKRFISHFVWPFDGTHWRTSMFVVSIQVGSDNLPRPRGCFRLWRRDGDLNPGTGYPI